MRKICYAVFYSKVIAGLVGKNFSLAVYTSQPAAQDYADYMNEAGTGRYHVAAIELKPVKVKKGKTNATNKR